MCKFHLVRRSSNNSANMMDKKGQSTEGVCVMFDAPSDDFDVIMCFFFWFMCFAPQ